MIGIRIPVVVCAFMLSLFLAVPSSLFPAAVGAQEATPLASDSAGDRSCSLMLPACAPIWSSRLPPRAHCRRWPTCMAEGAIADGGLRAPFPATTGANQATLLTGTWPAEHGVVGDRFFRTGSPDFADFATWTDPGLIQADTLPQAAERAGKQVVSVGWEGVSALDPPLGGPVVAGPVSVFPIWGGDEYRRLPTNRPTRNGTMPAMSALTCGRRRAGRAPRSRSARRRRPISPSARSIRPDRTRIGALPSTSTTPPTMRPRITTASWWRPRRTPPARSLTWPRERGRQYRSTLTGERDGQAAGFWLKTIDLAPDLSTFRLYYTAVSRIAASWLDCGERPECAEPGGFEEALNVAVGAPIAVDAAPLEAGLIDEATFVAQGITGCLADRRRAAVHRRGSRRPARSPAAGHVIPGRCLAPVPRFPRRV